MTDPRQAVLDRRREIIDKMTAVMVDELVLNWEPGDIDPDAPLFGTGLQLDSIDAVELVVAMERAFDVKLGESFNVYNIRTVNKMADAVMARLKELGRE